MTAQITALYALGSLVKCASTFTDPDAAEPFCDADFRDPDTVTFTTKAPNGTVTSHVYGVDPNVMRTAAGRYYFNVNAAAVGVYAYRWEGTGAFQAAAEGRFQVTGSQVLA